MLSRATVSSAQLLLAEAARGAYLEAQGFYEKLGFTACSESFDEAGIPHVAMRRQPP